MFSRYDKMAESAKIDPVDNQAYPDPLSLNYTNVQLTSMPRQRSLTPPDLARFWIYMQKNYGTSEADDILLTLNAIPYRGCLFPGDTIFLLSMIDLKGVGDVKTPGN